MHSNSILVTTNVHYRKRFFVCKKGLSLRSIQYSYLHFMFYSIQLDFKQILIRKQSHRHNKQTLLGEKKDFFSTIIFWQIQITHKGCLGSVWKISHIMVLTNIAWLANTSGDWNYWVFRIWVLFTSFNLHGTEEKKHRRDIATSFKSEGSQPRHLHYHLWLQNTVPFYMDVAKYVRGKYSEKSTLCDIGIIPR